MMVIMAVSHLAGVNILSYPPINIGVKFLILGLDGKSFDKIHHFCTFFFKKSEIFVRSAPLAPRKIRVGEKFLQSIGVKFWILGKIFIPVQKLSEGKVKNVTTLQETNKEKDYLLFSWHCALQ